MNDSDNLRPRWIPWGIGANHLLPIRHYRSISIQVRHHHILQYFRIHIQSNSYEWRRSLLQLRPSNRLLCAERASRCHCGLWEGLSWSLKQEKNGNLKIDSTFRQRLIQIDVGKEMVRYCTIISQTRLIKTLMKSGLNHEMILSGRMCVLQRIRHRHGILRLCGNFHRRCEKIEIQLNEQRSIQEYAVTLNPELFGSRYSGFANGS